VGAIGLALTLGGCSAATLGDMPSQTGALPAGTPERSATPMGYPAVHDMPPARTDIVLTKDEQKKAEAELTAARQDQSKRVTAADKAQ
jgi:hypothetical protein